MVNAALKEFFRDPREYLLVKQISLRGSPLRCVSPLRPHFCLSQKTWGLRSK